MLAKCSVCDRKHKTTSEQRGCVNTHADAQRIVERQLAAAVADTSLRVPDAIRAEIARREAMEVRRAERFAAGEVTPDTLPSPRWEQMVDQDDCGGEAGTCRFEDKDLLPCGRHNYEFSSHRMCMWNGRLWFRGDARLKHALGQGPPVSSMTSVHWSMEKIEKRYARAVENAAMAVDLTGFSC